MSPRFPKVTPAWLILLFTFISGLSESPESCAKGAQAKKTAPQVKNFAAVKKPQNVDMTAAFNSYLGRLRSRIQNHWFIPDGKNHVTVSAVINQDGSVTGLSLSSSPANGPAEQAASDAFNQSQPLESLPTGCQAAKLTLTFDSSADPHGDSQSNLGTKLEPINLKQSTPAATSP